MNTDRYPWLNANLGSSSSDKKSNNDDNTTAALAAARADYLAKGAAVFPQFLTPAALRACQAEARAQEATAFTTHDQHTYHLQPPRPDEFPTDSVFNYQMTTQVASIAYDELEAVKNEDGEETKEESGGHHQSNGENQERQQLSQLQKLYHDPRLLQLVSSIVLGNDGDEHVENEDEESKSSSQQSQQQKLYLSCDPLGCCSINVFRPGYHHSFHFDESEFSVTLCLQEAEEGGLFQYTDPIDHGSNDDTNDENVDGSSNAKASQTTRQFVAQALQAHAQNDHDSTMPDTFAESSTSSTSPPPLHTLDFTPGTLFIFSGSSSLHRVSRVLGNRSRLVAVLTFARHDGFLNSPKVQTMFWGRSSSQRVVAPTAQ